MGRHALGRIVLVTATVAALAIACSDRVPPPATPTSTATSRPTARPTASPVAAATPSSTPLSPPEALTGAEIVSLTVGAPIDLAPGIALIIETGCWQYDGPTTGLYRDALGTVRSETLLTVDALGLPAHEGDFPEHYITGFAARDDASDIVVSVCTRGFCGGLGYPTADAHVELYRSVDGGVTWRLMPEAAPPGAQVTGFVGPDAVLVSEYREEGPRYFIFPGNEAVQAPRADAWPYVAETGEIFWNTEGGVILRNDGSVMFSPDGTGATFSVRGPSISPSGMTYVYFTGPGRPYLVELNALGRPVLAYELPEYSSMGAWSSGTSLVGNIPGPIPEIRPRATPGMPSNIPAVFDLASGQVLPIPQAAVVPSGRNRVVAVQTGPFARVVNTGSCLNIWEEPSVESPVLTCARTGCCCALRVRSRLRRAGLKSPRRRAHAGTPARSTWSGDGRSSRVRSREGSTGLGSVILAGP